MQYHIRQNIFSISSVWPIFLRNLIKNPSQRKLLIFWVPGVLLWIQMFFRSCCWALSSFSELPHCPQRCRLAWELWWSFSTFRWLWWSWLWWWFSNVFFRAVPLPPALQDRLRTMKILWPCSTFRWFWWSWLWWWIDNVFFQSCSTSVARSVHDNDGYDGGKVRSQRKKTR